MKTLEIKKNWKDKEYLKVNGAVEGQIPDFHPDKELFDSMIHRNSGILVEKEKRDNPDRLCFNRLGTSSFGRDSFTIEGNYVKTLVRFWSPKNISDLKKRFEELNTLTSEFDFHLTSVTDFEEDPGERTYQATFTFFTVPKGTDIPKMITDSIL